ncbi:MAG TPA: hypothetical protein VGP43_04025 [Chitinophagaceae bacterium]|nr:hypothetical protein [Chitinophagaceae bacterium]
MKKIKKYLPDIQTVLNQYLDFLTQLPYITTQEKNATELIKELSLINPTEGIFWEASLDISDIEIQCKETSRTGVYWRTWTINYEKSEGLAIEAKSETEPEEMESDDYSFYFRYSYDADEIYATNENFFEWLEDVKNFKKYITEHLNEVVIDISVFETGHPQNKQLA